MSSISVSRLRDTMRATFSGVVREHRPVTVTRGAEELALLVGADDVSVLLDDRRFEPEIFGTDDAVSVWLPQLELYGQGGSLDEAREDLLDEVRQYVGEYLADGGYLVAPNRRPDFPYVLKAFLADRDGGLADVIFPAPPSA